MARAQGLAQVKLAVQLDVAGYSVGEIYHGRRKISPRTAVRLELAGFKTARHWLTLQMEYDIELERTRQLGRLAADGQAS